MVTKRVLVPAIVAFALASTAPARADDRPWFDLRTTAPRRAFELTLGTGYTQPFGMLERGIGMPSVAAPGPALDLGLGYRSTEHWSLALTGQFAEHAAERSATARSLTPGVVVTYHFRPAMKLDPWVDLSSGYRLLWENDLARTSSILTHGLQLARARVGLDYHEHRLGIGPFVGADANVFLWQESNVSRAIASPRVSVFVFAGVQGRWDLD